MVPLRLLVFLLFLFLAGCSSEPQEAVSLAKVGHRFTYDPAVPVNGGQKITLTFWTQANQLKLYQSLIVAYRQFHPNVEIDLVSSSYRDHFQKLQTALGSGIGPDLFHMHNEFGETLRTSMAPYPPDIFPRDQLEQDFAQVDLHLTNGQLYYLDTGIMTSYIFYDKSVWRDSGLEGTQSPRTWDSLRALAERLTLTAEDGTIVRAGFNPNGIGSALFLALNLQQGQRLFAPRDSRPLIDTPASRRSLEFLRSLYTTHRVTSPTLPPFHESLGSRKAVMIYAWGWAQGWLREHFPETEFGMFPIPTWDGTVPPAYDRSNGEVSMGVNAHSPPARRAVAFDVIHYFLAEDKFLAEACQSLSLIPSKRALVHDAAVPGQGLVERTIWPGPLPPVYEETLDSRLIDPVILDGLAISKALDRTQTLLRDEFRARPFRPSESQYAYIREMKASDQE